MTSGIVTVLISTSPCTCWFFYIPFLVSGFCVLSRLILLFSPFFFLELCHGLGNLARPGDNLLLISRFLGLILACFGSTIAFVIVINFLKKWIEFLGLFIAFAVNLLHLIAVIAVILSHFRARKKCMINQKK